MKEQILELSYRIYALDELPEESRKLVDAALEATRRSYAPYSHFYVGAAVLLDNGVIVTGNNQENVAFPSGLCAERTALFYANAGMHLELFNDRVTVQNRFVGSPFGWRAESMKRKPLYFELGAGVAVPLTPSWTGTAGAAVETGVDRNGVSGNVGVRYKF